LDGAGGIRLLFDQLRKEVLYGDGSLFNFDEFVDDAQRGLQKFLMW